MGIWIFINLFIFCEHTAQQVKEILEKKKKKYQAGTIPNCNLMLGIILLCQLLTAKELRINITLKKKLKGRQFKQLNVSSKAK